MSHMDGNAEVLTSKTICNTVCTGVCMDEFQTLYAYMY